MNINTYNQFYDLLTFIITGIIIGILFDIFRIFRKTFKTPDFLTYAQDILFWILVGIILLFSIFHFNNGEIRSYVFIGLIIGILIYILTISKYFIKISVVILVFFKNIVYFPFKLFKKIITKCIIRPSSTIFNKFKTKIQQKQLNNIPNDIINDNFPKN